MGMLRYDALDPVMETLRTTDASEGLSRTLGKTDALDVLAFATLSADVSSYFRPRV